MKITVRIPTAFRRFTNGADTFECLAGTLPELFNQLEEHYPGLRPHLRDSAGRVRPFINIYVNEEDIRFQGGNNYCFQEGDEITIVPSIAGGSPAAAGLVVVPGSSANLGCAFDCAAMALDLHLKARAALHDHEGFEVVYRGPRPELIPGDESNLAIRGMRAIAAWAGVKARGAKVEIDSDIPVGVGLGSSAAATLAGILLGSRLYDIEADARIVLRLATEIEGHPDNVAAAYHGGLVFSATGNGSGAMLSLKINVPADLEFVVVIPDLVLPTEKARAVLPAQYSRADTVYNLQRAALLAASCFSGRFDLHPELFRDRLHQPYRGQLIPGLEDCLRISHPALLGVFLSGAGSSVLAVVRHGAQDVAELLAREFRRHNLPTQTLFLKAENRGAAEWAEPRTAPR
jgi:homoserine kinase